MDSRTFAGMKVLDNHCKILITGAWNSFSSLPHDLLEEFLTKEMDFNFISQACAAVGITCTNFTTPPAVFLPSPPLQVINELVIDLVICRNSQSQTSVSVKVA